MPRLIVDGSNVMGSRPDGWWRDRDGARIRLTVEIDDADRRDAARREHGLGYCNITKCCTEVCPEHIKITDNALIPLKERVVSRKYDPLVWLGSKIFKRSGA